MCVCVIETLDSLQKCSILETLYQSLVTTFILQKLKTLVLGDAKHGFSEEWKYQSFTFSDAKRLQYGFVQKKVDIALIFVSIICWFLLGSVDLSQ